MISKKKGEEIENILTVYKDVPIDKEKLNPYCKPNFPYMASYDVLPEIDGKSNALIELIKYCK